jgi:hypothetical protein
VKRGVVRLTGGVIGELFVGRANRADDAPAHTAVGRGVGMVAREGSARAEAPALDGHALTGPLAFVGQRKAMKVPTAIGRRGQAARKRKSRCAREKEHLGTAIVNAEAPADLHCSLGLEVRPIKHRRGCGCV